MSHVSQLGKIVLGGIQVLDGFGHEKLGTFKQSKRFQANHFFATLGIKSVLVKNGMISNKNLNANMETWWSSSQVDVTN